MLHLFGELEGINADRYYKEAGSIKTGNSDQETAEIAKEFARIKHFGEAVDFMESAVRSTEYFKQNKDQFKLENPSVKRLVEMSEEIEIRSDQDAAGYEKIALFYFGTADYNKAVGYYEKLVEIDPEDLVNMFRLAVSLSRCKKDEEAYVVFEKIYEEIENKQGKN